MPIIVPDIEPTEKPDREGIGEIPDLKSGIGKCCFGVIENLNPKTIMKAADMGKELSKLQEYAERDFTGFFLGSHKCPDEFLVPANLLAYPGMKKPDSSWLPIVSEQVTLGLTNLKKGDLLTGSFEFGGKNVTWWINCIEARGKYNRHYNYIRFKVS